MSKEEQQQQVHTLVEYFKEQLRGVLEVGYSFYAFDSYTKLWRGVW